MLLTPAIANQTLNRIMITFTIRFVPTTKMIVIQYHQHTDNKHNLLIYKAHNIKILFIMIDLKIIVITFSDHNTEIFLYEAF